MTTLMTRRLGGALLALGPIVGAGDTRAQSYEHLLIFGSRGSGDGQFLSPTGVAVAASGDIVVADSDNDRIQVFDGAGTHQLTFGGRDTGNGQFQGPQSVALGPLMEIVVADTRNNCRCSDGNGNRPR